LYQQIPYNYVKKFTILLRGKGDEKERQWVNEDLETVRKM